jgi:hypothetical protein
MVVLLAGFYTELPMQYLFHLMQPLSGLPSEAPAYVLI